jgi:hypothetical protein
MELEQMSTSQEHLEELLNEHALVKTRVQMLQKDLARQAVVLGGIVQFLKSGGLRGEMPADKTLPGYLSGTLSTLLNDLLDASHKKEKLERRISSLGVSVEE